MTANTTIKPIHTFDKYADAVAWVNARNVSEARAVEWHEREPSSIARCGIMETWMWNQAHPERQCRTVNRYVVYEERKFRGRQA